MFRRLLSSKAAPHDPTVTKLDASTSEYRPTLVDSPFFLVSLFRQLHDRWRNPIPRPPKESIDEAAALPVTEMTPWFRNLPHQVRLWFVKPLPPRVPVTSHPVEVRNIWQDSRWQPASLLNSFLLHALVIAALTVPFVMTRPKPVTADAGTFHRIYFSPEDVPSLAAQRQSRGSTGGGTLSLTPATRGRLPRFARVQLAPPSAITFVATPQLPVTPTLIGPPQLTLPQMTVQMNWGVLHGPDGPPSNGPGHDGGIGDGEDGGVGNNKGPGYGPDPDGAFSPGRGGVTAPRPIYNPAPNYSEDARKSKLQGIVQLSLVVDAHGSPTHIQVIRSLGMGLDENAVEMVRTWKFKPGTRNGVPVPVRMVLEVTFRLF
jgi:TonB family protein